MLNQFLTKHPDDLDYAEVVKKMMAMQKFFLFLIQGDDAFEYFLQRFPEHKENITNICSAIKKHLEGQFDTSQEREHLKPNPAHALMASSKMSGFFSAFNDMKLSKGYSMMRFLNANMAFGNYLENHIHQLEAIYTAFKNTEVKKSKPHSPRRTMKTH